MHFSINTVSGRRSFHLDRNHGRMTVCSGINFHKVSRIGLRKSGGSGGMGGWTVRTGTRGGGTV